MGQMQDYYLHHDHLEENNHPVYFNEFARRLTVNGLQYLGEADFSTMISTNFAPEVAKTLNELGAHDIVQMEQYMDFVRCRYFRQTLICRSGIRLSRSLSPGVVKSLYLATNATPTAVPLQLDESHTATFQTTGGYGVNCKSPLTKLALRELQRQWPEPLAFADLVTRSKSEAAKQGHAADGAGVEDFLAGEMLACMAVGVVEWQLTLPSFTTDVGKTPAAPPLARLQANQGYGVTNLRGESVTLDEIHRQTLRQLDGSRDIARLTDTLMASVKEGVLVLHREDDKTPITEEKEMRKLLGPALDKVLQNLARKALLMRISAYQAPQPGLSQEAEAR
jgi:methyltransferase-like protein